MVVPLILQVQLMGFSYFCKFTYFMASYWCTLNMVVNNRMLCSVCFCNPLADRNVIYYLRAGNLFHPKVVWESYF